MEMTLADENVYTRSERHQRLARLYLDCGESQAAIEHLESALRYRPEDPVLIDLREEARHFS